MNVKRRDFLKLLGAGAIGAGTLTLPRAASAQDGHNMPPDDPTNQDTTTTGTDWAEMDAHHEMGVNTFLENIGSDDNFWGVPLEFTEEDGVKVFNLTCEEVNWEVSPGMGVPAMAYNGIVPGPYIRVTEGDRVRINLTNNMPSQSTAIHFHGLRVPNSQDGVPFVTQPVVQPGQTASYEFTLRNAGTHMYHSHHNAAEQVTRGLLGAFIVDPADTSREPEVTADYTMVLNDSGLGFTINGKSFPYTQPILATLGDRIRIRYMNEGLMIHPMHLHGIPQLVFAKDGFYLPAPYMCDTLNIAPGERYDVLVECDEAGYWAFHCHILTHAESRAGMFGMVTVLAVQE